MSSALKAFFNPNRQAPLITLTEQQLSFHGSILKAHPSQLNFDWIKRLHSRKFVCRQV